MTWWGEGEVDHGDPRSRESVRANAFLGCYATFLEIRYHAIA